MTPKVSVCVPTYNRARYIAGAIESVLAQTFTDFEVVVFDDASTGETADVVAAIDDPRIRYARADRNAGIAASRNRCLEVARGTYIGWLDSDDVYVPEMLATQSAVLDRHLNVGLAHGAYHVIDHAGRQLPDWPWPFSTDVIERGATAFASLVIANYVTAPTVLVRRECHDRAGRYAPEIGRTSSDWDMWLRLALHGDVAFTATPVAKYRYHASSISADASRNGERLRCDRAVVRRVFAREAHRISNADVLRLKADAALAARGLLAAGDAFTAERRWEAMRSTVFAISVAPRLSRDPESWRLLVATATGDEYQHFRAFKALLRNLAGVLAGTRIGGRLQAQGEVSAAWVQTLERVAGTVRDCVPRGSRVAVVDKWDPTVLHLSGRRGWHFPHRPLLPDGYPKDSGVAIEHLEYLRRKGASYLVFPNAAFWWLEHYGEFRAYLDRQYSRIVEDDSCVIYKLVPESQRASVGEPPSVSPPSGEA
jgi:glycosyltransferase involved in cell wall biosynthesis